MDAERFIKPDLWLGGILERPVFRVTVPDVFGESERADGAAVIAQHGHGPAFLYAKVPAQSVDVAQWLEAQGFRLVDTNVTFEKPIRASAAQSQRGRVRDAQPADREAVMRLAGAAFEYTRFHLDPAITSEQARTIKAEWAGNFFTGRRGDAMVVAEVDGAIGGFLQLLHAGKDDLVIDLIAVDGRCRGRGIATEMIAFAEARSGRSRIVVGTQVANVPSVRLYEKMGFRLHTAHYVLHRHTDGSAP